LPKANEKNLKEMPQEVRDQLTFILAEQIEEILPAAYNQDVPAAPPAERN
jgi:ATP-dependent Lon protease